jgi:hypothetical protein
MVVLKKKDNIHVVKLNASYLVMLFGHRNWLVIPMTKEKYKKSQNEVGVDAKRLVVRHR